MANKLNLFNKSQLKQNVPDIRPGDIVRVHLKLPEKTKRGAQKTQIFEGLVIACKHGKGINGTFTVRKISLGVGVEKIFPFHSPSIMKIDIVKRSKVRRAKLYYIRKRFGKKARMKTKKLLGIEWISEPEKNKNEEENKSPEKTEKNSVEEKEAEKVQEAPKLEEKEESKEKEKQEDKPEK